MTRRAVARALSPGNVLAITDCIGASQAPWLDTPSAEHLELPPPRGDLSIKLLASRPQMVTRRTRHLTLERPPFMKCYIQLGSSLFRYRLNLSAIPGRDTPTRSETAQCSGSCTGVSIGNEEKRPNELCYQVCTKCRHTMLSRHLEIKL